MRSRCIALIATTPPFRRLARAATTTSPLGAKVIARSSATGGRSRSPPTHVAPREAANWGWEAPRVETKTAHFQERSTGKVLCATGRPDPADENRCGIRVGANGGQRE